MSSRGFLVCADITGYTSYLSHSELEHASGILSDLLTLLLSEVQAPLHLSRVEGDAVISYAIGGDGFRGQLVVDRLDDSYVAFRRALRQMVQNTTCTCNACATIEALDLKFVVHHGEFLVQRIGQQDELVGPEVNLLFRLTKNRIRQELGLSGYVAFTAQALDALALPAFATSLSVYEVDDPDAGPMMLGVRDMEPVWQSLRDRSAIVVPAEEVVATHSHVVATTPEVVFALLARPETRAAFFEADGMEVARRSDGRIGPDAVYVCAHGGRRVRHTVIDWAPPERYAFASPVSGGLTMVGTFRLEEVPGGTRVDVVVGISPGLKAALMRPVMRRMMTKWLDRAFVILDGLAADRSQADR